ncbi:type II toxin-antitoxin system VapC family toxin [Budviciaceae bacterium CWB-B4]|uniref:Ribonuclease VapC n=1 Tax=Limnobaculum xujianqingii TaxID=2738837 RepID=A0A9D7AF76_9GAMM|nr:type II toxin-antitoxin system VapC family toxin [Limnobaculum xujianqingii]MBK5071632.1 type II toxin-antitoxin system VapC family toxin [Limnobaculum xujianqingii]MBK5174941.1 type II toxin-antitoxin system VapC family toxin [Limnobaculum xujianqingii]
MIILDTNIVSEMMRARPDPAVLAWLDAQDTGQLSLTSITVAEILYGIARMPEGRRRDQLFEMAESVFEEDFSGRLLAFDEHAAVYYAELVAQRDAAGRPIGMADAQIAAICRCYDATLATRNIKDFEALGIVLINPFN